MEADDSGTQASGKQQSTRWGLSVLNWHCHAIDVGSNHPIGVFVAFCGHFLMMVTTLHNYRPTNVVCRIRIDRSSR